MEPPHLALTFIVRLTLGDGGALSGVVEQVRSREKQRFDSVAALAAVIAEMAARETTMKRQKEPTRCSPPRSDVELTSAASTIFLHDSGWVERGANHEHVDVTWQFGFDPSATGRIYQVEAAATDDDGFSQPFEPIGTLAIGAVCGGDCGADGVVAANELVLAVNIASGEQPLDACLAADENRDEAIEISDLIAAVNHALTGCAAS